MAKDLRSFQLPKLELEEFIDLDPLSISPQTLVIDAIAQMNQPRQSSISHDSTENHFAVRSSHLLVLEKSQLVADVTQKLSY